MVNWTMIGSMILPNTGGWLGALTMAGQVKSKDEKLKKPRWNPPNGVFGPAWTVLYTGIGYASYMVYRDCGGFTEQSVLPLALYGGHLVINWTWTPVFFRMHKLGLAFIHIVALDAAAAAVAVSFFVVNKNTAYFMAPYLGWLGFASFLNYTIWKLNRKSDKGEN